jgi:hypothetical protein
MATGNGEQATGNRQQATVKIFVNPLHLLPARFLNQRVGLKPRSLGATVLAEF